MTLNDDLLGGGRNDFLRSDRCSDNSFVCLGTVSGFCCENFDAAAADDFRSILVEPCIVAYDAYLELFVMADLHLNCPVDVAPQ